MILGRYDQQPVDIREYRVTYGSWLEENEKIAAINELTVSPEGLVINDLLVNAENLSEITFIATGGISGERYKLELTVTTNAKPVPRTRQDEILITVIDT